MNKNGTIISILLGAVATAALAATLGWADSKPKVDVRAQQIESMQSRIAEIEDRLNRLELLAASNVDGSAGVVGAPGSLEARVTALEQRLVPQFVPAQQSP